MNTATADVTDKSTVGTASVRQLNNELRQNGLGGRTLMTAGIAALPPATITAILAAVKTFDEFDVDNDPYGEHDCATLTVDGERIFWKVDYYDTSLSGHSPNAADPAITVRVLTIMLADEY